jgi:uncharacterized peroxidase-related enzyme
MAHLASLPAKATLLDVFRRFPETNAPLIEYHEALLRGPSPFSDGERELIAAYVSGLNRCRYCHGVHAATAQRLTGVSASDMAAMVASDDFSSVDAAMRPVLTLAGALTRDPRSVTPALAEAVTAAGWDETAYYHLVATTALFNLMNRLVEGLGIELDPAYVEPSSKRLAEGGYLPLLKLMKA